MEIGRSPTFFFLPELCVASVARLRVVKRDGSPLFSSSPFSSPLSLSEGNPFTAVQVYVFAPFSIVGGSRTVQLGRAVKRDGGARFSSSLSLHLSVSNLLEAERVDLLVPFSIVAGSGTTRLGKGSNA
jgi:hypothetical protein